MSKRKWLTFVFCICVFSLACVVLGWMSGIILGYGMEQVLLWLGFGFDDPYNLTGAILAHPIMYLGVVSGFATVSSCEEGLNYVELYRKANLNENHTFGQWVKVFREGFLWSEEDKILRVLESPVRAFMTVFIAWIAGCAVYALWVSACVEANTITPRWVIGLSASSVILSEWLIIKKGHF